MYYDELYHDTRYEIINRSVMIPTPLDSDIIKQLLVKYYIFPIRGVLIKCVQCQYMVPFISILQTQ